jgi:hypothetical protein
MADPSKCAAGIAQAMGGGKLTEAEIKFLTEELQKRAGEVSLDDKSWIKIAQGLAAELREATLKDRQNARQNIVIKQRLMDMAKEADEKYGNPVLALEAAMVGVNRHLQGNRLSSDALAMAIFDQYAGGIIAELERGNLLIHLNDGHLDLEVARALEKLADPNKKGSASKEANEIAAIVNKYRLRMLDRSNRAGSMIKKLTGFITRQSHDASKVHKAGFKGWSDFILPLLDHKRTFDGDHPDKVLRQAHRTLASGGELASPGAESDLKMAFSGPGNLGKRISEHRVLHFKDADAWMTYNEKFGFGNLRQAILGEITGHARNTALMETFGSNPRAMFDEVRKGLIQLYGDDPQKLAKLKAKLIDHYMDEITGHSRIANNLDWANRSRTARGIITMAKLGGAVISSVTDIGSVAAQIRYQDGGGILTPFAKAMQTFFEGIPSKDRAEVADRLRVGLDGMIGSAAERFGAVDSQSGTMANWLRTYFKFNLLTPWTDAWKRGMALMAAHDLGVHASKAFGSLPAHMKAILRSHSIDAPRWELLRQAVEEGYMHPDALQRLSDEEFIKRGLDPVEDRDKLESAIRTYLIDATEFGVPTPGARERAMMVQGTQPGTALGEALRFMMQFKAFPFAVTTKVLGRMTFGNPSGKSDKAGLAMYIASTIALGYIAMSAKSIAKGQDVRDPLDPSTWTAALLQGGGLGIYGDFLFGEFNRFGRSATETAVGPGIGTIADVLELWAKVRAGDDVAANALRLIITNAPGLNLFYTRTALDYLILYQLQEMANPGYLRRMERRLEKEQGQRYLFKRPSEAIPYGGGNRIFEGIR